MSGLAALFEQKLTGLHSYFGQANCFSAPGSPKHLSVSTAFGATVASSSLTDSCEEELSTAVLRNDLTMPTTMPKVPKEDATLGTNATLSSAPRTKLARSDTMEASPKSLTLANLGKFEPLSTLKDEFKFNKSFGEKVDGLIEHQYKGWRRVRGDGNCFYRAVSFSLLEQIISAPENKRQAAALELVAKLKDLSFEEKVEEEGHQQLVAKVSGLANGLSWQDGTGGVDLLASFEDTSLEGVDQACIRAIRRLTAKCIIERADDWTLCGGISFRTLCEVQGLGSPEDFCNKVVLPMGVEAESVVMNALVCALDVGLKLALLDRSEQSGLVFEEYKPPGEGTEHFTVHVQLRPGHYDLLYVEHVNEITRRRATIDGSGGYAHGFASSSSAAQSAAHTLETLEPFRL